MIDRMDRKKLTMFLEALAHRIRDFPPDAIGELFETLETIERKYDLLETLSEEDRMAIERGQADIKAGRVFTDEEVRGHFKDALKDYDADTAGREALLDAVSRVQKLSGQEQRDIAYVIFAVLNEPRLDIPHPSKKS